MNEALRFLRCGLWGAALAALLLSPALAQKYPDRQIKIVVPSAPGGGLDLSARTLAAKISETLGTAVIVENRPGAAGKVGIGAVIRSPADGYTFLISSTGPITLAPLLEKLEYDPGTDLVPVAMVALAPFAIAATTKQQISSIADLIALAKKSPDGLKYAVAGFGNLSHLVGELLKQQAGIKLTAVPYASTPPVMAVISGDVSFGISELPPLIEQGKAGTVRLLAVTSSARSKSAPDLPTVREAGFPEVSADPWQGLFAPKGTPPEIVDRVSKAVGDALALPDVQKTLLTAGLEPQYSDAKTFATFLSSDSKKWAGVVKSSNISELGK